MKTLTQTQRGLSLVELMIAMLLGLLVVGAVIAVFVQNSRSFRQDQLVAEMQENGRHALNVLVRDLTMVGYWGGMTTSTAIVPNPESPNPDPPDLTTNDCGPTSVTNWAYQLETNLQFLEATTPEDAHAAHSCIATDEILPGTDVLSIKRAHDSPATSMAPGRVYLKTNGTIGTLFACDSTCSNEPATPGNNWEYLVHIYFVRSYSVATGDALPTLYRKVLTVSSSVDPAMETESGGVAEGIEDFHAQFGVDGADADRTSDYYTSAPPNFGDVVSARVFLLVRSREPAPGYSNTKTYQLGDVTAGPFNDAYYRRVYSTTVQLRNPTYLGSL